MKVGTQGPRVQDSAGDRIAESEMLYQHATVGLALLDPDLCFVRVNDRYAEMTGRPVAEHIGASIGEVLPELQEFVEPFYRRVLETGEPLLDREVTGTTAAAPGEFRHWLASYLPLKKDDRVEGVVVTVQEISELKRAELELAERLRFEEVLADLSAVFVNLPPEQVDAEIETGLGQLGSELAMDLGTLLQWDRPGGRFRVTHEWHGEAIEGPPEFRGVEIDETTFPWLEQHLPQGEAIRIGKLADFPREARLEREVCEQVGIRSVCWVPYEVSGRLHGYLAFNTTRGATAWSDGLVRRLQLAGEVFGNALARAEAETALVEALEENERLKQRLEADNLYLRDEVAQYVTDEIVGNSPALRRVLDQASQVASTDSTVLILGETGTGKELLARFIHQHGDRSDRPLIKVNCAALPANLVEAELFGREKGAYTGAMSRLTGRFEVADGSTIFLDEIGDLPVELQVKLLRVLQDGEFERLGSTRTLRVDVRLIAATNRDLERAVREQTFREDLYYRLNVFPITVPPLRDRREDIPQLVWSFLQQFVGSMGKTIESIPREAMRQLVNQPWPGNVRELRNVVERAMIVSRGPELIVDLPQVSASPGSGEPESVLLDEVQRRHILQVLEGTGWRVRGEGGAADLLGLVPSTLESRMQKLGIKRPV